MTTDSCGMALSQYPVFLVGYPRSGSTLLQALLEMQGHLVTFPETHFFSTLFKDSGEMILTVNDGHPVKRVHYATEVSHDKTKSGKEDDPETMFHGIQG